ncbi:MAG: DNA mismatch repair protein MutS [Desulfovibrio sp.]|nr:DNA mismatch repair protein MutS [Desulfovibrio sp.]
MPEPAIKISPMFEQYNRIKAKHPDALLFYRMGDFYELFFEDARVAARELQLTLTSRNREAENPVPMCGVPWHAADTYVAQLIDKGYHVAICDQTEDPKAAKGLVKRAVSRVITPGTILEDANLNSKSHNYLAALCPVKDGGGLAWADVSTGQWSGVEFAREAELWQWVQKLCPRELLLPEGTAAPPRSQLEGVRVAHLAQAHFAPKRAQERLLAAQGVREAAALGLDDKPGTLCACGALLAYLEQTQMRDPENLMPFVPLDLHKRLIVDDVTERNLEIFVRLNGRKGKGTLRHLLDRTMTPMGGRLLEDMLHHPWRDAEVITRVQDAVAYFGHDARRGALRDALAEVYDLERLSTRISLNQGTPRDFIALRNSLAALPGVLAAVKTGQPENAEQPETDMPTSVAGVVASWDDLKDCRDLLQSALVDNPPITITDGGLFRQGYNAELDRLMDLADHGEQQLQDMLLEEQRNTGISKLKLGYHRAFGYFFEITRAASKGPVPEHFIRRQSLANAERFTTEALKNLENALISATDKRKSLEYTLFQELRDQVNAKRERVVHAADMVAHLDYWQNLAEVGRRNGWCRPELTEEPVLDIREGRHPVVEEMQGQANFVPNDFRLGPGRHLCLLTGPNMSGKSTVLRQVAIICLLAQMGSPVPATKARLGLVDRLFSRVGASDNLAQGQSTFMVEMMETARILRQSTQRSLLILDEIGRGTSTYDGVALAWAVVEDLARRAKGCLRTLFATHYHELTALEGRIKGVFTMNIAIREHNNDILFLHKLVPGPSDRSYGVEVARLAGVPGPVVQRARVILAGLERGRESARRTVVSAVALPGMDMPAPKNSAPPELPTTALHTEHPVVQLLRDLQPEELSPMAALKLLMEWKTLWGQSPAPHEADHE